MRESQASFTMSVVRLGLNVGGRQICSDFALSQDMSYFGSEPIIVILHCVSFIEAVYTNVPSGRHAKCVDILYATR